MGTDDQLAAHNFLIKSDHKPRTTGFYYWWRDVIIVHREVYV